MDVIVYPLPHFNIAQLFSFPSYKMSFNVNDCYIKQVWCGNSATLPSPKYSQIGTRSQCLRKGFGAGKYTEERKHLPPNSLRVIPYVGDVMEANFAKRGIKTVTQLIYEMNRKTQSEKNQILQRVLQNKDGKSNGKAYNSVLMFLHNKGVTRLPTCKRNL